MPEGDHPIVPVMLGDAVVAKNVERLLELGIYAIGFFYPVVPQGKARIRVQISAGHTQDDLDKAVAAFATASGNCLVNRSRGPVVCLRNRKLA